MNKFISVFIIVFLLTACNNQSNKKESISVDEIGIKEDSTPLKKIVPEITPESKLNGQFQFGLSQADKREWPSTSRAYKVRSATANSIKMKLTYYGNGKGVYFHDNGKYEYMTKKMIEEASFDYKIIKDSILIKEQNEERFKLFGIIKDESINKDYFDIDLIGKADFDITFGMYKIGESPKK